MMGLTAPSRRLRPDDPKTAENRWDELRAELDLWASLDRTATFWWRDDDAIRATPALDRMLALADTYKAPLALAVIQAKAEPSLFERLAHAGNVTVLQHGYAHTNRAPADAKRIELGGGQAPETVLAELAQGLAMLQRGVGDLLLPVLVPPWNRIDLAITAGLPGIGLRGLSTAKPRAAARDAHGVAHANIHVDPIDWAALRQGAGGFLGVDASLAAAIGHLRARRRSEVDPEEPTGLLTHHLVMDEATWGFVDRFLAVTAAHPAACWLGARDVFADAFEASA